MPVTEDKKIEQPATPVPVEPPVTMQELTSILVKHYNLHEGCYDLLVEYQIGMGAFGPNPAAITPSAVIGVSKVGLLQSQAPGPTSVDAALVNPRAAPTAKKSIVKAAPKKQSPATKKPAKTKTI